MIFMELTIFAITFLIIWNYQRTSKWRSLPGFGSWSSLPILGHAYKMSPRPTDQIPQLQKKFGNVFRMDVGFLPSIFVCDFDSISEVSVKLKCPFISPQKLEYFPSIFCYIRCIKNRLFQESHKVVCVLNSTLKS